MSAEIPQHVNPSLIGIISRAVLCLASTQRIEISGKKYIPRKGPAFIVINHMAILEALSPYAYLPETPIVFTKAENFNIPLFSNFIRGLSAIPVNREEVDRSALRKAHSVLVEKKGIIFTCPEGTRGRDKDENRTMLKQAKAGVVYMAQRAANALKTRIPISPWAVWGTEGVLPEIDEPGPITKRFAIHRDNVFIRIGEPYYVYPSYERKTNEDLQKEIDNVMLRIRDMLPQKYHGYYAKY